MIKILTLIFSTAVAFGCVGVSHVSAQSMPVTEEGSLQVVINSGGEDETRLSSHGGVLEPLALTYDQLEPLMLACSPEKAGEPVTISPLDGEGEIVAGANLSVANDGTVAFSVKAGPNSGRYRVLVTIGADQYELQLHVTAPPSYAPPPGPASTPPPNSIYGPPSTPPPD